MGVGLIITLSGCQLLGSVFGAQDIFLNVRFSETNPSSSSLLRASTTTESDDPSVLYFGELELVAYSYRPGESVQNHQSRSGFSGSDWSYYVALASGYDWSRDILLSRGSQIDFSEVAGTDTPDVSEQFVNEVGSMRVDVFEAYLHRMGVVIDGEYFGMNAELNGLDWHPLHRSADLGEIPDFFADTYFQGFDDPDQNLNVFFVSNDWFTTPGRIRLQSTDYTNTELEVRDHTFDDGLSTEQESFILNLVNDGTTRRFYTSVVIVPYGAPVYIDFSQSTPLNVDVQFDLSGSVDWDQTDLEALRESSWTDGNLYFSADDNFIPFGLSVSFD
ncbi:MAG: hypothetical protein EA383_17355 [Spirochaetaceae bacterium]|nr:MAG: hypothetical protein EA383_17355 [Spirochaetaceae bacterium]